MERREFLKAGAAAASLLTIPVTARAQRSTEQAKLARLAIMSLSFGAIFKNANQPDSPARVVDIMDIGEMYADRFGIHNVEMQHAYFPSTSDEFFKTFKAKLDKIGSRVSNINLELGGGMTMSADSAVARLQTYDLTARWIDHAVLLGCPRMMLNQGQLTEANKAIAIATLKMMGDYGRSKGVKLSLEPRGGGGGGRQAGPGARGAAPGAPAAPTPAPAPVPEGPPPPPAYLLLTEVIKGSGTYANVDIANFGGDQDTQHAGIRAMMPYTVGNTHVRLNPGRWDVPAAVKIIREEFKYTGLFSIESGIGAGADPYANIQDIRDVMLASL